MEKYIEQEIEQQLRTVVEDLDLPYTVKISAERQFNTNVLLSNEIYIVYKENSGQIVDGNKSFQINYYIVSEENSLSDARLICDTFVSTYTQKQMRFFIDDTNVVVIPYYNTPVVLSNFVNAGLGVRAIMYFNGQLIIMHGLNDIESITYIDDEGEIEISTLSSVLSYATGSDTQPFFNKSSFATTIIQWGNSVFSFTSQLKNNRFYNRILYLQFLGQDEENIPDGVNTSFKFRFKFTNGLVGEKIYKYTQSQLDKKWGALTTIQIVMTQ